MLQSCGISKTPCCPSCICWSLGRNALLENFNNITQEERDHRIFIYNCKRLIHDYFGRITHLFLLQFRPRRPGNLHKVRKLVEWCFRFADGAGTAARHVGAHWRTFEGDIVTNGVNNVYITILTRFVGSRFWKKVQQPTFAWFGGSAVEVGI